MSEADTPTPEQLAPDEHARNRGILEALLVVSDVPIGAGRLASALSGIGVREIRGYIEDLNADYISTGRSFQITEIAGGFQLTVHPEYAPWIRQMMREKSPARLSQAALETLSIIAYKQPMTKAEMEHIRGVSVDGVLRHLLEKGLIRIAGRSEGVGRPLLYGTTRDFLKHFGLKTLSDLPKMRELEELLRDDEQRAAEITPLDGLSEASEQTEGAESLPQGGEGEVAGGAPEGIELGQDDGGATASEPVSGPGGGRLPEGERPAD